MKIGLLHFFVLFFRHLAVHKDFKTYMGIHVIEESGEVTFFQWRVMFLGVSDGRFPFQNYQFSKT